MCLSLCVLERGEKDAEGVTVNPDYPGLRIHCLDYLGASDSSSFPLCFTFCPEKKRKKSGEEERRDENKAQIVHFASPLLPGSKSWCLEN